MRSNIAWALVAIVAFVAGLHMQGKQPIMVGQSTEATMTSYASYDYGSTDYTVFPCTNPVRLGEGTVCEEDLSLQALAWQLKSVNGATRAGPNSVLFHNFGNTAFVTDHYLPY